MDYDQISVEGIVLPNVALSDSQLEIAAKELDIPNFIGWYTRDKLPKQPLKKECGITNTDLSTGKGLHWVCWYKDDDLKIFFNSCGNPPLCKLVNYLKSPIKHNTEYEQPYNTVVCGHLCLYVLKRLSMGDCFKDVINSLMDYDQINVEGIVLPNKRLLNIDIDYAIKQLIIPNFIGCFCRDELPKQHNVKECGILNHDDSRGGGTHWTAFFKDNKTKIYFDSYGLDPPLELVNYLKSPIYCNTDKIQPDNTVVCGHLCLFIPKRLSIGESFQDIINNLI